MRALAILLLLPLSAFGQAAKVCFDAVAALPDLAPIRSKVAIANPTSPPFSMLANKDKPTPEEQAAIAVWGDYRETCISLLLEDARRDDPAAIVQVVTRMQGASQRLIAALHSGSLTYGEFNAQRAKLIEDAQREERAARSALGLDRTEADLRRDEAACRYEITSTNAVGGNAPYYVRPGAGPIERSMGALGSVQLTADRSARLMENCLIAKGWEQSAPNTWRPAGSR